MTTATASKSFQRTRVTYLGYTLMGCFALALSLPGPMMPFLAERLGLSYTQMGLHFTANAAGNLLMGFYSDALARMIGNRRMAWIALVLLCVSLFAFVYGTHVVVTLTAMVFYGIGIGLVATLANATIADEHPGQFQTRAFSEANIVAGSAVTVGPFLVGMMQYFGLGWQATVFAYTAVVAVVALIFGGTPFPAPRVAAHATGEAGDGRLPPIFWVIGIVIFLAVSIEWLTISWSADFFINVVGLEASTAASLVSVFAGAIVIGRVVGRQLLEYVSEQRLLLLAFIVVMVTFPVYWLSPIPVLNVIGLFAMGLGVGNLFPLTLSAAMAAAGAESTRAGARITVFSGLSNMTLPQLIGSLADVYGMQRAYGVLLVLAVLAVGMVIFANRMRTRMASAPA